MKINLKFYATLLISVYLLSSVSFAQTQSKEITFVVSKNGEKFFSKDAKGQKTISFIITGISTLEDINSFAAKFKAIGGVINLVIDTSSTPGSWGATATFSESANKKFLQSVLIKAGVNKVIIDGKTMTTEEVGTYNNKSKE